MLFINSNSTNVYFNLASEEYFLKSHPEDIFMLWQADHAVVLGKYQNVQAEMDGDFVEKREIDIARRYSGGGAVYHDSGNVNLTFIENTSSINFDKYIREIVDFLSSIGIQAQTDERRGIHLNRFKISGSAQCVYKNRVMYHCTLLYSSNLDTLHLSLNGKPEEAAKSRYTTKSVKSSVTNICTHLPDPADIHDFKKSVFDYFFNLTPENHIYNLSKDDLTAIERLKDEKYATPQWIQGGYAKQFINSPSLCQHSK